MFKALLLLLIVSIGFVLGPLWSGQTGYVLIAMAGYTVETSVVVLVISVLLVMMVLWFIEWLLRKVAAGHQAGVSWAERRQRQRGDRHLAAAFNHLLSYDYESAQKEAEQAASYITSPQNAYLLAALAAAKRNDYTERQRLLSKAAEQQEGKPLALLLAQAEAAPADQAKEKFQHLREQYPDHAGVLRMAAHTYFSYQQWPELRELIPQLEQHHVVGYPQLQVYTQKSYQAYFSSARNHPDELLSRWQKLDKKRRRQSLIRIEYIAVLQLSGTVEAAEKVVLKGLRKDYLEPKDLVFTETRLNWEGATQLTDYMQERVKKHPEDTNALALLGLVALHQQDLDLAEKAFRKATDLNPNKRFFQLLGDTLLAREKSTDALAAYKAASQQDT